MHWELVHFWSLYFPRNPYATLENPSRSLLFWETVPAQQTTSTDFCCLRRECFLRKTAVRCSRRAYDSAAVLKVFAANCHSTNHHFYSRGACKLVMSVLKLRLDCLGHINSSMAKADERGHPANFCKLVSSDLQDAINFHASHSCSEVSEFRLSWCTRWLPRAPDIDREEKQVAKLLHQPWRRDWNSRGRFWKV